MIAAAPLYSEAAAAEAAGSLLARIRLPVQSTAVAHAPAAEATLLRRPQNSEDWAKAVDRHAFWISRQTPADLLAFVARHGPAPTVKSSGFGEDRGRPYSWYETLEAPTTTALAGPRQLLVSVVRDGRGRYAMRIDALAVWHRVRPVDSLVPASAVWLKASVTEAARPVGSRARRRPGPTIVSDSARAVRAIAQAVNDLPVAEASGPAASCPAQTRFPATVVLVFRRSASSPELARVTAESGDDCGRAAEASVWITTPREHALALTDHPDLAVPGEGASLLGALEAALGHRLQLPS